MLQRNPYAQHQTRNVFLWILNYYTHSTIDAHIHPKVVCRTLGRHWTIFKMTLSCNLLTRFSLAYEFFRFLTATQKFPDERKKKEQLTRAKDRLTKKKVFRLLSYTTAAAGFCILYDWLHLHNLRAIADKVRRGPSHLPSAFLIVVVVVGMRVITPQQQPVTCGREEAQEYLKHAREKRNRKNLEVTNHYLN